VQHFLHIYQLISNHSQTWSYVTRESWEFLTTSTTVGH